MEIPLKQLPQQFQEIITELQRTHKTLIITDEGKPIATIAPIAQSKRAPFGSLSTYAKLITYSVPKLSRTFLR